MKRKGLDVIFVYTYECIYIYTYAYPIPSIHMCTEWPV